jgi:photosynthetic reaction center cytochrome c subunit
VRRLVAGLSVFAIPMVCVAQTSAKFPPDSLVNTRVIAHSTPVIQLIGTMRNFTFDLGVRCQYCHVGTEGQSLAQFNFASDDKRTKLVARQMMLMVQEINRRLDSLPGRASPGLQVTCNTCHRGTSRPIPLYTLIIEAATTAGSDSATRAYRGLRGRFYGSDAYDFGEGSLSTAAFRLGNTKKFDEAFAMLRLNEEFYPTSSGISVVRGNISLMKADTAAAEAAFREAVRRDPTNAEAKGRLQAIGKQP